MVPIFIVGATGSGKSAAALELARGRFAGRAAILSMDAMQVYRGADIGTSKPSPVERAEVPHGGLDLAEFGEPFDVARYLEHAAAFLREQTAAGRRVIIVGGTGLYFRALTRGLCEAPPGPEPLRAELNALPVAALQERLRRVDPAMLELLDADNPRRLARAIEVMESTGKSLRMWQAETPEPLVPQFEAFWVERPKGELNIRLAARVEAMFAQGWIEEVRGLIEQFGADKVKAFPGIGYREIAAALAASSSLPIRHPEPVEGSVQPFPHQPTELILRQAQDDKPLEHNPAELKRDILVSTRQYAKRQLTWFAREPNLSRVMLIGPQPFPAGEVLLP